MDGRPLLVDVRTVGPPHHGVTGHMRDVAAALSRRHDVRVVGAAYADVHHAAFCDSLHGGDIAAAFAEHLGWAARVGGATVVTLHDVPATRTARDQRRAEVYRAVAAGADGVVVCTDDEASRVHALTGRTPAVVALPVPAARPGRLAPRVLPPWPAVGVLGWVFPGKGHDVAIDVAGAAGAAGVVAIGAVAARHADLGRALGERATAAGVRWHVTGNLDDHQLLAAAASVAVPVAAYDGRSASASLRSWVAAGRRPLATATADARSLFGSDEHLHVAGDRVRLTAQVTRALAEPSWTRGRHGITGPDVGSAHLDVYLGALDARTAAGALR